MPKARTETVVKTDGGMVTYKMEVGERGNTKEATYTVPATPAAFQDMVSGLKDAKDNGQFGKSLLGNDFNAQDETPLAFVHRLFKNAVAGAARALVYESVAPESTYVTVAGQRHDLIGGKFKLLQIVRGYNNLVGQRSTKLMLAGIDADDAAAMADPANADKIKDVDKTLSWAAWSNAIRKLEEKGKVKYNANAGVYERVEGQEIEAA